MKIPSRLSNPIKHCILSQQFNKERLEYIFDTADKIKSLLINKEDTDWLQSLLSNKRAVLYFIQPSTRTFLSFANACHILGIRISDVRNAQLSSEIKGETHEDTIRTFSNYADLIIMRHPDKTLAERAVKLVDKFSPDTHIINAGSGPEQHPTQALLDVYTIKSTIDLKNSATLAIIGDLKRGRAVKSLIYMIANYPKINLLLISPAELKVEKKLKTFLKSKKILFRESDNLKSELKNIDIFYLTRIQDEYDNKNESSLVDYDRFSFQPSYLKTIKKNSIIMHPFPRRNELSSEIDSDKRAIYWEQEKNGLYIRTALITYMFGISRRILNK